jgi:hypothetical protein
MLVPALRRFGVLLVAIAGATAAGAAVLGLLFGSSLSRSISVGFYLVGSFVLLGGFFVGNRGPLRAKSESLANSAAVFSFFGPRRVRVATKEEREEQINLSALFIVLGLALLAIGVAADSRNSLI